MSMNSAFVQWISRRFPENLNPVFVKEMRQILHSGIPQSLILILILSGMVSLLLGAGCYNSNDLVTSFSVYQAFLGGMMLITPLWSTAHSAQERAQDGIAPELSTVLSPSVIFNGKLQAVLLTDLVIFLAGLPFLICFYARQTELALLSVSHWTTLLPCTILFLVGERKSGKNLHSNNFCQFVSLLFVVLLLFFDFLREREMPEYMSIILKLFLAVYFYVWGIACLKPENSNRMFLPRLAGLFLLAASLLLILMGSGMEFLRTGGCVFAYICGFYAAFSLLLSLNEPLKPSARCLRGMPKAPFDRLMAVFRTGAYPGYWYSAGIMAVGLVILYHARPLVRNADARIVLPFGMMLTTLFYATVALLLKPYFKISGAFLFLLVLGAGSILATLSPYIPDAQIFCFFYSTDGISSRQIAVCLVPVVLLLIRQLYQRFRDRS